MMEKAKENVSTLYVCVCAIIRPSNLLLHFIECNEPGHLTDDHMHHI